MAALARAVDMKWVLPGQQLCFHALFLEKASGCRDGEEESGCVIHMGRSDREETVSHLFVRLHREEGCYFAVKQVIFRASPSRSGGRSRQGGAPCYIGGGLALST